MRARRVPEQREADEERDEGREAAERDQRPPPELQDRYGLGRGRRECEHADDRTGGEGRRLPREATSTEHEDGADGGERQSRGIRRQRSSHREHGQRDDGHRDELEPLDPPRVPDVRLADDERERRHRKGRGQREADPGCEPAQAPRTTSADRDAELARRRAGQQARDRDQLCELLLVEPFATLDVLGAEVPDVRDRAAERREPEPPGNPQNLRGGAAWRRL